MVKLNSKKSINGLCYFALSILGFYICTYQNALADITAEYSLDSFTSGLIVSLHFSASFIFPFLIGPLSDKKGRKPTLFLCVALISVAVITIMISRSAVLLLCSIFVIGGSSCITESTMSSLLSENNPGKEAQAMNISQMYFCLGAVLSPILGVFINSISENWRGIYSVVLVLILSYMVLLFFTSLPEESQRADKEESYIGKILRNKYFLLLLLAMFLYVAIEEGTAFWTAEFVSTMVTTSVSSAFFLSIYWLGMSLGRLIAALYKGSIAKLSGILLACSVPCFLLILYASDALAVFVGFFLVGFGLSLVWPLLMTLSTTSFPDMPNTAAGGVMSAGAVGAAVAPIILGTFTELFSIRSAFLVLFAFLVVLFIAQLLVTRRKVF